jgi:transcriptional regulator with XRE-family HTH domain
MIPVATPADLGDALRLIRKLAGRTQTDIGFHLGTTPQRIGDYENAKLNPSARTLLRLLDALGYQLAIVPLIETAPETAPASTETAQKPPAGIRVGPGGLETESGASEAVAVCGHCGGPQRGYASLGDTPLCHPDTGRRRAGVMDLEDQYRFTVEPVVVRTGLIDIWLSCDRCRWSASITDPISLADLNQRADEHTEACR